MTGKRSHGNETRYDRDYGGNHIQAERDSAPSGVNPYRSDFTQRRCTACDTRKAVKGGSNARHGFICADCRAAGVDALGNKPRVLALAIDAPDSKR